MPSRSRQVRRAEARRAQAKQKPTRSRGGGGGGPSLRERVPKVSKAVWLAAGVVVVLVVAAIAMVSLGSSQSANLTGTGYPNGNTSNTRYVGGPIDSGTVSKLETAWTLPITGKGQYGSYAATPVIADGVVYSQDLGSNVQAIDLKTGKVLWTKTYEQPDHGPNGLVVAGGRVYGVTPNAAFSLDEQTGEQVWMVSIAGEHATVDMAPGYHNGVVYVSSVPGDEHEPNTGDGVGTLYALDGKTGQKLWHFNTVPEDLWSTQNGTLNSGGGAWYTPAFDESGDMYFGVANPEPSPGTSQFPWGSSRPGPDLYTDSILKLDASTGKLQWYYQQTPHDLYDHDLQDPPILTSIGGKQAVITAGKGGVVVAIDRQTGKPLWKRPVGIHNGHDNDGLYAMRGEYSKLHLPETVYPGRLGGVIAPMATNGSSVFVPVVNLSEVIASQTEVQEPGPAGGELVALNAATGAIEWTHKFSAPAYGGATAVNDLVFATTFEGIVYGLDASNGSVAWETKLPAGTNSGVAVSGDTLIAPAGLALANGQTPELVAYRLPGGAGASGG
jgi:outer membrane protein assembly factor BamB